MKNWTLVFLLFPLWLAAQRPYFQQNVDYKIRVTLDDKKHTLTGDITFAYQNNSPDALSELWIHCWPNAHASRNSALNRQFIRMGNDKLWFAADSSRGGFTGLDFSINGLKTPIKFQKDNPDVGVLTLAEPLKSGQKLVVSTPFVLKIPGSWSRLGHIGQSYQITQWFPKPAVYDPRGWHAIPYLNMGEFYSEFGSFDVEITLPENYVVGATGICLDQKEETFLKQKLDETQTFLKQKNEEETAFQTLKKTNKSAKKLGGFSSKEAPFPASSTTMKTLHFTADRVHDFAFFADKRFYVVRDTAVLPSGKKIPTWAYFTSDNAKYWQKDAFFVKRAVESYSAWVGEYPYPQCSAVHSALSAGGGMEYPMVTVINSVSSEKSLDDVTAHEIGHNWFYGILGSNERDYGWLDEGINSFYENRYMKQFWGSGDLDDFLPKKLVPKGADGIPLLLYKLLARAGRDQSLATTSDKMSELNYGLMYQKPVLCLRWLEKTVGREAFDRTMHDYFDNWKFKHPHPENLQIVWKEARLPQPTDWFFETMNSTKKVDFKISKVKKRDDDSFEITLKNKGNLAAPFTISGLDKNGVVTQTQAVEGFLGTKKITVSSQPAKSFVIDNERVTLDLYGQNNRSRVGGLFPKAEPLKLRLLNLIEEPTRSVVGICPWLGVNENDGFMAGLAWHSSFLPPRRFQYFVAPAYGFRSKKMVGVADFKYNLFIKSGFFEKITVGLGVKKFSELNEKVVSNDSGIERMDGYRRLAPSVEFFIRPDLSKPIRQSIRVRYLDIFQDEHFKSAVLDTNPTYRTAIQDVVWSFKNKRAVNPFSAKVGLEFQKYTNGLGEKSSYSKAIFEWKNTFSYARRRGVHLRVWGTVFLKNTVGDRNRVGFSEPKDFARGSATIFGNAFSDYRYDEFWLGREAPNGFNAAQTSLAGGGFHSKISNFNSAVFGASNRWVFTASLVADLPKSLPGKLPLKPYFDFGMWQSPLFNGEKPIENCWSVGVLLQFKALTISFPIKSSTNLEQYEKADLLSYFGRITWSVPLGRVDLVDGVTDLVR